METADQLTLALAPQLRIELFGAKKAGFGSDPAN
jgi:hypothetical protein